MAVKFEIKTTYPVMGEHDWPEATTYARLARLAALRGDNVAASTNHAIKCRLPNRAAKWGALAYSEAVRAGRAANRALDALEAGRIV